MNTENFQWDTETLFELINYTINNTPKMGIWSTSEILEEFKASKQRKLLLITEDGVEVYDKYLLVTVVNRLWVVFDKQVYQIMDWIKEERTDFNYFSCPQAAEDYILKNKPCFSLKDITSIIRKINDNTTGRDNRSFLTIEMVELAKYKNRDRP